MSADNDRLKEQLAARANSRHQINAEAQQAADNRRDEAAHQVDVGDQVAYLSASLRQANAAVERARALLNEWVQREAYGAATHSEFCYQWHPDCLVRLVRRVLEEAPDG